MLCLCACTKEILQHQLNVQVNPISGGTVSPSSGAFEKGQALQLLASPAPAFLFKEWQGSLSGNANPASLTMDADKSITAVFERKSYPLNLTIEGSGTVKEEILELATNALYPSGTRVKLSATPAAGWQFLNWKGDALGNTNPLSLLVEKAMNVTAVFETKPFIPVVGNFYKGGIITRVYKLMPNDFNYTSNESKPNFIIEKMALEDMSFTHIKDLIQQTLQAKIGESQAHLFFNSGSPIYWTSVSDSLVKYGGKRLDILEPYYSNVRTSEREFYLTRILFATYYADDTRSFSSDTVLINGKVRLVAQEFIINDKNIVTPKLGDRYGQLLSFYNSNQAPPLIFSVDAANKKFKIFQTANGFGYVNYNTLAKYIDQIPYNVGYGFRLPTMKELEFINTEFYLKGQLRFGNFLTFSSDTDPNDASKVLLFDFANQKSISETKDARYLRVTAPLLVKEIPY